MAWRDGISTNALLEPADPSQWIVLSDWSAARQRAGQRAVPAPQRIQVRRRHKRALEYQGRVYAALCQHPKGLTTRELCEALGVTRSVVYLASVSLVESGFASRVRDARQGYRYRAERRPV